jgi:hypothetical protein
LIDPDDTFDSPVFNDIVPLSPTSDSPDDNSIDPVENPAEEDSILFDLIIILPEFPDKDDPPDIFTFPA